MAQFITATFISFHVIIAIVNKVAVCFSSIYSRASLIWIIHLSGHLLGNQSPCLNRKRLTYPEIQLSGQSVWERRCPDKWGSTIDTFCMMIEAGLLTILFVSNGVWGSRNHGLVSITYFRNMKDKFIIHATK